jgi:hypothetical protein
MVALSALVLDSAGRDVEVAWAACLRRAQPDEPPTSPACLAEDTSPFLVPLGSGIAVTAVVPQVSAADLGPPDSTGGIYLPIRARVRAGADGLDAVYRLRLAQGTSRNHNPRLAGVFVLDAGGTLTPLEETSPRDVPRGQALTLRSTFTADSAETYTITGQGSPRTVTEILRVSWFATGGSFSEDTTGGDKPDTVFKADQHLPPAGSTIDVWIVGRDERGGGGFLHRRLILR